MGGKYSEDNLIEQPAIELFKTNCYAHEDCYNETFNKTRALLLPKLISGEINVEKLDIGTVV